MQALQAPACHENMVKVGGYILGEFGNLIAGDPRSGCVAVDCFVVCCTRPMFKRKHEKSCCETQPNVQWVTLSFAKTKV